MVEQRGVLAWLRKAQRVRYWHSEAGQRNGIAKQSGAWRGNAEQSSGRAGQGAVMCCHGGARQGAALVMPRRAE